MQTVVTLLQTFKLPISFMKRVSSITNSGAPHYAHNKQHVKKSRTYIYQRYQTIGLKKILVQTSGEMNVKIEIHKKFG